MSMVMVLSAEMWTAGGSVATAVVALVAAVFAGLQVREAKGLREAQAQPFIVVNLEPSVADQHYLMLRVENLGQTLARDVRFKFDPPLASVAARKDETFNLAETRLVREGLPTMPPGMKIERVLDNFLEWDSDLANVPVKVYSVTVECSDRDGKRLDPLEYRLDLEAAYTEGSYLQTKTLHDVAQSLDQIRRSVGKWGETNGGVKVYARDGDAKDAAWRAVRESQRRRRDRTQATGPSGALQRAWACLASHGR